MKLSIEAKVAAAVAAGFIALTAAAIGQGGSDFQSNRPNHYNPFGVGGGNAAMIQQPNTSSEVAGSTSD
jgi:hypothetical protein